MASGGAPGTAVQAPLPAGPARLSPVRQPANESDPLPARSSVAIPSLPSKEPDGLDEEVGSVGSDLDIEGLRQTPVVPGLRCLAAGSGQCPDRPLRQLKNSGAPFWASGGGNPRLKWAIP